MTTSPTFAEKLAESGGRPSGFDYMRLCLAAEVFMFHCFIGVMSHENVVAASHGWFRPISAAIVPMFFALSGFLVAGSLERCETMVNFLGLRVIRILPALATEVTISALVLGPIFTSLPIGNYFQSNQFFQYFLNIVGYIQFYLPGVFQSNPHDNTVNGQLWTIPFELECYAALGVAAVFAVTRRRIAFSLVSAALFVVWQLKILLGAHWHLENFAGGMHPGGRELVFAFLAGVSLYMFRDRVLWSWPLALICAIIAWALLLGPITENLAFLPLAYLTVFLGLANPKRIGIIAQADLSYGIYLFGSPVQQAVIALATWTHHWYIILMLAGAPTIAVAWVSWNFVEKPALNMRHQLKVLEEKYVSARSHLTYMLGGKLQSHLARRNGEPVLRGRHENDNA